MIDIKLHSSAIINIRERIYTSIIIYKSFFKDFRRIGRLPIDIKCYENLLYGKIKAELRGATESCSWSLIETCLTDMFRLYYNCPHAFAIICNAGRVFCESNWQNRSGFLSELKNENHHEKYWESIMYSYVNVCKLPKRYLTDAIGVGEHGIIFERHFGRVEKIGFRDFTFFEYKFYSYIRSIPMLIFPKVYFISQNRVIMERLETAHSKLTVFDEYIKKYIKTRKTGAGFMLREADWDTIENELGENHWFRVFVRSVEDGLNKIFGFCAIGDFRLENIGIRKDGSFVYFDPINSSFSAECLIEK